MKVASWISLSSFLVTALMSVGMTAYADEINLASIDSDGPMLDDASDKDDVSGDAELSYSSAELREQATYGFAAALGATDAWQNLSIYSEYFYTPRTPLAMSIGAGGYTFRDSDAGKDYDLKIDARTVNGGVRYFFTDYIPFYTQTSLGYSFWTVDCNPSGVTNDPGADDDRLSFSGRLHGAWVGQQIGVQIIFGSGFTMDVSIIGFAKSFVLGEDFTHTSTHSKKIARKQLETPLSWGLLNVRLGFMNF